MIVGTLQLDLMLYESYSLKDKRSLSKRLIADLRNHFSLAIAEVESQDLLNRLGLGIAVVGSEARLLEGILQQVIDRVQTFPEFELLDATTELIHIN